MERSSSIQCAAMDVSVFPTHSHKKHEILFFVEGTGTLFVDGIAYRFYPGTIALIPPDTTHSSSGDGDVKRLYLQGDFIGELPLEKPVVFHDNDGEGALLIRMIYDNRFGKPAYLDALCHAYLQFIASRIHYDDATHQAVWRIVHTISENCCDSQCDVTAILQDSGYAVDYIRSLVKQYVGKSPHSLLTESRIQRACFLMETYRKTVSLSWIAEQCGYTDYVHFSKTFKSIMQCSPREFLQRIE